MPSTGDTEVTGVLVGGGRITVDNFVGVDVMVGNIVGVGVLVDNFVGIGVTVGSNNCAGPQLEINRLKAKTRSVTICCFVFIASPMFS
jgi:hypothetical protein